MILRELGDPGREVRLPDGILAVSGPPGSLEVLTGMLDSGSDQGGPARNGPAGAVEVQGRTVRVAAGVEGGDVLGLLGLDPRELAFVWAGIGPSGLETRLDRSVRLLAAREGLAELEAAMTRLTPEDPLDDPLAPVPDTGDTGRDHAEALRRLLERIEAMESLPAEVATLERELRSLRADAAEVGGDLEVRTMEWLRERQDAETQLQAYRDRARELKTRLAEIEAAGPADAECPTCGKTLAEHFEPVVRTLREEWESVVQDGTWWRRRREQLELKPAHLQKLEGRSVRLYAATESVAEELERRRAELERFADARARAEQLRERLAAEGQDLEHGVRRSSGETLSGLRLARSRLLTEIRERLLDAGSRWVNALSGGRLGGLDELRGEAALIRDGTPVRVSPGYPHALASLALRLGLVEELVRGGFPLGSVAVGELEGLGVEAVSPALSALRTRGGILRQVLLFLPHRLALATPDAFDAIVELEPDVGGVLRGRVRTVAPDPIRITLKDR